jgi:formylglycine-generating enzyme required for sulfatase activity
MKRSLLIILFVTAQVFYFMGRYKNTLNAQAPTPEVNPQVNNAVTPEFVSLAPGSFIMGCDKYLGQTEGNECYDPFVPGLRKDATPPHTVTLTKMIDIGKYEVTQEEWKSVMKTNPSHFGRSPRLPVENVRTKEVLRFLDELNSRKDGYHYRLPTEAEWEYAARAGVQTHQVETGSLRFLERDMNGILLFPMMDWRKSPPLSGTLDRKAWYSNNSGGQTHEVGGTEPNSWKIVDMLGNVAEIVEDVYKNDYYETSSMTDPVNNIGDKTHKVLRGGGWNMNVTSTSVWFRQTFWEDVPSSGVGFRYVREREASHAVDK